MTTTAYLHRASGLYPVTDAALRHREQARASFGEAITPDVADALGYDTVTVDAVPAYDPQASVLTQNAPQVIGGHWTQTWTVTPHDAGTLAANLALKRSAAALKIDADVDALYGVVLGNRAQEYALAESDATAYKAAGYSGTVPPSVQSWATAKGWTATQSADDILVTATAWRGAQAAIRANRLGKKEAVKAAADSAAIEALLAQWSGFLGVVRGQLGL